MADDPTPPQAPEQTARRRTTWLTVLLVGLLVLGGWVVAFTPRTVAEGGRGEDAWRLRVAPGLLAPTVRLDGPGGLRPTTDDGNSVVLDATVVWGTAAGDAVAPSQHAATVVVGPTPRGARSIRVTSIEGGVGEARIERVLWRRVHVAVLPADARVTELVAIGGGGQILEVVRDLPPPASGNDGG